MPGKSQIYGHERHRHKQIREGCSYVEGSPPLVLITLKVPPARVCPSPRISSKPTPRASAPCGVSSEGDPSEPCSLPRGT